MTLWSAFLLIVFLGIDPVWRCFLELSLLHNYLVTQNTYKNAVICVRRGGKTERRRRKKMKNTVQPGRAPEWVVTFCRVCSRHTVCGVFWGYFGMKCARKHGKYYHYYFLTSM